jgi:hypothetical protein
LRAFAIKRHFGFDHAPDRVDRRSCRHGKIRQSDRQNLAGSGKIPFRSAGLAVKLRTRPAGNEAMIRLASIRFAVLPGASGTCHQGEKGEGIRPAAAVATARRRGSAKGERCG